MILVDADLRKPGVLSIFNVTNTRGLTDMLRHQSISSDAVANLTEQDNLRVVTTGPLPPNPAELLGSKRCGPWFSDSRSPRTSSSSTAHRSWR